MSDWRKVWQSPTSTWNDEALATHLQVTAMGYQSRSLDESHLKDAREAVLARFSELRQLLTGRTMHCGMCEDYAKQAAELRDAICEWARRDKGSHVGRWAKAHKRLHEIAEQHPVD